MYLVWLYLHVHQKVHRVYPSSFARKPRKKSIALLSKGNRIPEQTTLSHHLRKEKSLKSTVFQRPGKDTQHAELEYETLETYSNSSLLEVKLYTGRFHQIRAQLAFTGHPISGDKKYGATSTLPDKQIALYAYRLIFEHPISKEEVCVESPPPTYWPTR